MGSEITDLVVLGTEITELFLQSDTTSDGDREQGTIEVLLHLTQSLSQNSVHRSSSVQCVVQHIIQSALKANVVLHITGYILKITTKPFESLFRICGCKNFFLNLVAKGHRGKQGNSVGFMQIFSSHLHSMLLITGPPGAHAVRCKTRDHIKRITRTAILDDLPFGAFIAQFSCNSCHSLTSYVKHSMQFMAQRLVIVNMIQTALSEEICLH